MTLLLASTPGVVEATAQAGITGSGDQRYDEHALRELPAVSRTFDMQSTRRAPAVAAGVAADGDARFVTTAPLAVSSARGTLVLLNRYWTLFAEDDVALFTELAVHAVTMADRATALAERQHLAVIVGSSHDAIIGKTLDGIITSWNAGAQDLYGYAAAETIGQHASMLIPPSEQDTEDELMARVAAGERIDQLVVSRRRKGGVTVTVSLTMSPITDPTGLSCLIELGSGRGL